MTLKRKRLSVYLAALERAVPHIVGPDTLAATMINPRTIQVYIDAERNRSVDEQIHSVTHELIHQVHRLETKEEPENSEQEKAINALADDLVSRPEWWLHVLLWLHQALTEEFLSATGPGPQLHAHKAREPRPRRRN